jgi:hypothetical protein
MHLPVIIPPGYGTMVLVILLAIVSALGICLAAVWVQFKLLEARQRELTLRVNDQLRDQFSVFNSKLSGQIVKFRRELEGTEQKLEDTFQRKMEVLEALSTGLKLLERRLGRFVDTQSASGFLEDLKEDLPAFEILDGGKKSAALEPSGEDDQENPPIEKTSAGNN